VSSQCSLLRNYGQKPTGVLEHCRDGENNCWFFIFLGVSFWQQPTGDEGCQCAFVYSQYQLMYSISANFGNFWTLPRIFAVTIHIWRPSFHPQPQDVPCCGDRDPLITRDDKSRKNQKFIHKNLPYCHFRNH
jgi:hypothetical protein